jgi:RNA polymerase sigma-70 factor (ECF subfamily)
MDYLRKQARHNRFETGELEWETIEHGSVTPRPDVQIDVREQTQAAMMNLSETERAVLLLRHFEGHSIKEIANILDLTTGACKQAVFRAVKKMRIELRPLVTT